MSILLLGQNHRTAPVELREQLAFDDAKIDHVARLIHADEVLREGVILSTCNRAELYVVADDENDGQTRLGELMAEVQGVPLERIEKSLYWSEDNHAIRHLFRVASGLDSMVLGEGQILSQVKKAYAGARDRELTQEVLHRAFNQACACGKKVRTDTRVGEGAVSVAFAAVELAKKIFKDLSSQKALLIGAGATGRKVAQHLKVFGVEDILVTNRTAERAQKLAAKLDAGTVPWEHFSDYLDDVAIVVTAASVNEPIFDKDMGKKAVEKRGRRPLFLIDLGVPRNIDAKVSKLAGVFLYNVDHLEGVVEESSKRRRGEAEKAEVIVDKQVCDFLDWFKARSMTPTLRDLRRRIETIRESELASARHRVNPEVYKELERITHRVVNKILHAPTVHMKNQAGDKEASALVRQVRELFGLDDKPML